MKNYNADSNDRVPRHNSGDDYVPKYAQGTDDIAGLEIDANVQELKEEAENRAYEETQRNISHINTIQPNMQINAPVLNPNNPLNIDAQNQYANTSQSINVGTENMHQPVQNVSTDVPVSVSNQDVSQSAPQFTAYAHEPYMQYMPKSEPKRIDPRIRGARGEMTRMSLLLFVLIGVSVITEMIIIFLYSGVGINMFSVYSDELALNWIMAVSTALAYFIPTAIYLKISGSDITELLRFEHKSAAVTILGIITGVAICFLANYPSNLVRMLFEQVGVDTPGQGLETSFDLGSSWVYILAVVILAPVIEEFVFRGVMLSKLEKYGTGFAIITSSIIFAIAHLDISIAVFAFFCGLCCGFIYTRTRNLWAAIAIHMINNGYAVFSSYSGVIFGDNAEIVMGIVFMAIILLGAISLTILLTKYRTKIFNSRDTRGHRFSPYGVKSLSAGESAKAIFTSLGFWVIFGMTVIYMISATFLY